MATEMLELGRGMPGFIDFKSFRADDGEQLSVAWWDNQETLAAWRNHPRHQLALERRRSRSWKNRTHRPTTNARVSHHAVGHLIHLAQRRLT
jgi:heme-degrading monooxygenase HmoA